MALIDLVRWDAPADQLVWKFPNSALSTMTQLIVNESQSAILFKDGKRLDVFGAGRHTLSTNNIPLLNRIVNLPFGGKSPFAAEVWFCNRAIPLDLKWGTPTPLQLEDPQYGVIVPVSAFGQMGIRVKDPAAFVGSLVGTLLNFSTTTVLNYFKGVLVAQLKATIAQAIVRRKVPILQIETELVTLSEELQRDLQPHYDRYGLEVQLFRIMSISVPEDDPGVQELKKGKAAAARRRIEGTNYAQERSFDAMQTAAGNQGMGGMAASLGAGLGVGQAIGGMVGHMSGQVGGATARTGLHPDLSRLIEAMVADGIITDREREVLRRKAVDYGADPDEIEILVDGRLHSSVRAPNQPSGSPVTGFDAPVPAQPSFQYHVSANGQQFGPYKFEQVRQAAVSGQLRTDTLVWRDGLPAWVPAGQVPELAPLFAVGGPPPFGGSTSGSPPPGGT